ncbi:uncharacterized protein LOC144132344 isoform X2 [Amblyomma americanum]
MKVLFLLGSLAGLIAHYQVHGHFEDLQFACSDGRRIPFNSLCDGIGDCNDYYRDYDDEDPTVCQREWKNIETISLKSKTQPNGSVLLSWSWNDPRLKSNLNEYVVKGESARHSFSTSISPAVTSYVLRCLHGWTRYKVSVQPHYTSQWKNNGKPAEVYFFTASSAPSAPADIIVRSAHSENVVITVVGPLLWNSEPLGFEVQWAEKEGSSGPERRDLVLPPDWFWQKNELNVTLPLQPGREYNVSVRARGKGDAAQGGVLNGAVLSTMVATTPRAPVDMKTRVLDSKSAIISWTAPSQAQYFMVELWSGTNPGSTPISSVKVAGSSAELTVHSFPLLDLSPLMNYTARVQACIITTCSDVVETEFVTPRRRLPAPSVEMVKSVSPESISLEWSLCREGLSLEPEFEIRLYNGGVFRAFRTDNMKLTVTNLTALTSYRVEIRAVLQTPNGLTEAGPHAEAVITTWSSVPLEPIVTVHDVQAMADVAVLQWTFVNSTVEDIQVRAWLRSRPAAKWRPCGHTARTTCSTAPGLCCRCQESRSPTHARFAQVAADAVIKQLQENIASACNVGSEQNKWHQKVAPCLNSVGGKLHACFTNLKADLHRALVKAPAKQIIPHSC